jgi:hypothetical protein
MTRFLAAAFFLLPALAGAATEYSATDGSYDRWYFNDLSSKLNPLFSEFKYFNFQDPGSKLSAAITYSVISPGLFKSLAINAFFHDGSRFRSLKRTFPLSCVRASKRDVSADLCKEGRIEVLAWGPTEVKLRVEQDRGPIRWDLVFTTPMSQITPEVTPIPLDGAVMDWNMNWSPVARSGQVEGTVSFVEEGKTFAVNTGISYHDQNWEIWYPKAQPFNWMHYTGLDSRGERVDLLLVEFPRNTRGKANGLTLYSNGAKSFWQQGQYQLTMEGEGRIPVTRHLSKNSVKLQSIDRSFASGEHAIPLRYRIRTNDGLVDAVLEISAAISTSSSKPSTKGEDLLDEQLLDARIEFVSSRGDVRTATGPGEFMRTLTGP